jgi:gluconokinase
LKRSYREILSGGRGDIRIVYVRGSRELMAERLKNRKDYLINPTLLDSQFDTLEEPASDEPAATVEADGTVTAIIGDILSKLDRFQRDGG